MDMQDKEFDDVFRSKLDGFEAEPTGRVWEGIDEGLDTSRRRAIYMPILRIAASIILVAGLGVLFLVNRDKVSPVKGGKTGLVKATVHPVKKQDAVAPVKLPEPIKTVVQQSVVNSIARVATERKSNKQVVVPQKQDITNVGIPGTVQKAGPKQEIADIEVPKKADIIKPVVPGPETPLTIKTTAENIAQTKITPQVIAQVPATEPTAKPKRRGIHNFGDLVNIVVAKVDKRKDKAIQFTDSDDDESTITAVNIGPVKINKDTNTDK